MISIPVSEAYAFDHLTILLVKQEHGIIDLEYRKAVENDMEEQIGGFKLLEVMDSQLFYDLFEANNAVWELVEKAGKDQCLASEVDKANQRRYAAKKALQERFFPEQPLIEVKAERP